MSHNIKKVKKILDAATVASDAGQKSDLYRKLYLAEGELKRVIKKETPGPPPLVFWFQVFKYYAAAAFSFLLVGIIITLVFINNTKGARGALAVASTLDEIKSIMAFEKRVVVKKLFNTAPEEHKLSVNSQPTRNKSVRTASAAKKSNTRKQASSPTPTTANEQLASANSKASKSEVLLAMRSNEPSARSVNRQTSGSSSEEVSAEDKTSKKINSLKLLLEIEEKLNASNK